MSLAPTSLVGTPPDLLGVSAPRSDGPRLNEKSDLREVAEGFEALFLRQMLSAASKSDFGGDDLFGNKGDDTFTEMRDAQFAEIASKSGSLGIADMLELQLGRQIGINTPSANSPSPASSQNQGKLETGGRNGV